MQGKGEALSRWRLKRGWWVVYRVGHMNMSDKLVEKLYVLIHLFISSNNWEEQSITTILIIEKQTLKRQFQVITKPPRELQALLGKLIIDI
jgi:hypothetical protein